MKNTFYSVVWAISLVVVSLSQIGCSQQDFGLPAESQQAASNVTYNNKVDILLMVDNSPSMSPYQGKFSQQVPAMIQQFNQAGLDYHIAVVTTDMRTGGNGGMMIGSPRYLTKGSSNLIQALQARVSIGDNGSELERGLESLQTVLQPSYLTNQGSGFFRDDAVLAMVVLTNEDDYSAGSTSSFRNFFDQLKPPMKGISKAWVMNFIGVISDTGTCRTTADFKDPGIKYMSLADYSGGIKASVCDASLADATKNLRQRIVEILSEVVLKRVPKIESIRVYVNGTLVPRSSVNGWEYNSTSNSIKFYGTYQPGATDSIRVDYDPATGT